MDGQGSEMLIDEMRPKGYGWCDRGWTGNQVSQNKKKIHKYLGWAWGLEELGEIQYVWGPGSYGEQREMRLGRQIRTTYHKGLMHMDFTPEVTGSC